MNATQLLTHFDRLAEAPDAVPRLRRFILDLAVRGKLVEQDSADEPAAVLLRKISAEKARLSNVGIAGKQDALDVLSEADEQFSLPPNWLWVPATYPAYIVSDLGKKVQTKDVLQSGIYPVVDQGKVFIRGYCNDKDKVVRVVEPLILFGDHTRETKLIDFDFVVGADGVKLLQPVVLFTGYYFLALQWLPLDSRGYGRHFKLLKSAHVPLPPLAEQHRIVAKVDELMALCDQLEAAQQERERRRDRLAAASLQRLNQPVEANPATDQTEPAEARQQAQHEQQKDHAHFHLQNLNRLTTRPEHIKAMRQMFLNLAVRGKLVGQCLSDEPAPQFFERIQRHKAALINDGKHKVQTAASRTSRADRAYPIPLTWMWVTFGSVMISRDSDRIPVSKEERNSRAKTYDYYGASGVIDKIDDFLFAKPLLLIGEDGANLINRSTPIAFIARGKYWVNNHAHVLDGISEAFLQYVGLYINAVDLKPYVTGTAQPKMNQAKMNGIAIALPPEAEQNRIVAKVDELMVLCDQLEAQLSQSQTDSRRLLEAVLEAALTPA